MVTLLREFHDPKKASHKYFSVSKSEFSWEHCPERIKQATLGVMAVNNVAESALGGCTRKRNVQTGNRIHLSSAAAISDAKKKHLFDRSVPSKRKSGDGMKSNGIFLQFDKELQRALLEVGVQDAPATCVKNNEEVKRQRNAKRMKVEIARELGEKKAAKKTIKRTLFRLLYDLKYCMKGHPNVVAQTLKKLNSDSAKRDALKNNIYIRTKGFGWTEFHITIIHNHQPRYIRELSDHLRMIIRKEKNMEIPDKPPVDLPQCCPYTGHIDKGGTAVGHKVL